MEYFSTSALAAAQETQAGSPISGARHVDRITLKSTGPALTSSLRGRRQLRRDWSKRTQSFGIDHPISERSCSGSIAAGGLPEVRPESSANWTVPVEFELLRFSPNSTFQVGPNYRSVPFTDQLINESITIVARERPRWPEPRSEMGERYNDDINY